MKKQLLFDFGEEKQRPSYIDHLLSPLYRRTRALRLTQDSDKCVWCGCSRGLQVDHLSYANLPHETTEDIQTLCFECHRDKHIRELSRKSYRNACIEAMAPPKRAREVWSESVVKMVIGMDRYAAENPWPGLGVYRQRIDWDQFEKVDGGYAIKEACG